VCKSFRILLKSDVLTIVSPLFVLKREHLYGNKTFNIP